MGGPSASPVGSWTHVALTYDGSQLLLYVNGVQVASRAASGAIQSSTSPLWIGGNQYGENFTGLIDDVRVYNRALTPAEIQTDMATPLGGASSDTTPPSVPSSVVASAVSSSQVNVSWTASTDNVGVTGYRVERCQGAGCTTFAQVGTPIGHELQRYGVERIDELQLSRALRWMRPGTSAPIRRLRVRRRLPVSDTTPPSVPLSVVGERGELEPDQSVVDGVDGQRRGHGLPCGAVPGVGLHELCAGRDAGGGDVQ